MTASAPSTCPRQEELVALLEGTLCQADQDQLEGHLGECPACLVAFDAVGRSAQWETWERLLAGPDRASSFFPRVPRLLGCPATRARLGGLSAIPGFEILQELGRGGMGIVYKAREISLNRIVALKVLLPQHADQPEPLRRFRGEALAAARLRHPNIVQIHAVGDQDGHPYLTLEYVNGPSLRDALREGPWPPAEAAALIATLARAVHAAHVANVVHRDLKPGNILLAPGEGASSEFVPKIADLGLAKHLDGTRDLTQTGLIAGTPGYMAPEQASGQRGETSPATDVFALGAILYELLTGRPPVQSADMADALRQTIEDDPVPPRVLQPRLARDLETIVLKCLRKSPGQRYATAADLAEDLNRFLRGEPIRARPPSFVARLWKWGRRHPASTVALAALSLGFVVALGSWLRFTSALQAEQARTEARRAEAEQNYRLALAAVNDLIDLTDDPDFEANGLEPLKRRLLARARGYFVRFHEARSDDPEQLALQADALVQLARIDIHLNTRAEVAGTFDQAADIYRRLLAMEPASAAHRLALVRALRGKGHWLREMGRFEDSRAVLGEAVSEGQRLNQSHPDVVAHVLVLASVHHALGWTYLNEQRYQDAARQYEQAIATATPVTPRCADDPSLWLLLGKSHYQLAHTRLRRKSAGETLPLYRESLVARRRALRLLPDSPQAKIAVVISLNGVARSLSHLGRLKEARTVFLEALELGEPLVRLHPLVDRYAHHVSFSHQGLGQLSQKENRFAEAERYFRQAVEARESIARRHPEVRTYVKDYFLAARGLRGLLKAQGKHSELLTVYRETAEMYEWYLARPDARPEFRTPRALLLHLWARFLLEQGQWEEGLDVAARAVRLLKDSLKESRETSPRVVVALKAIHEERARAFETLGRTAEAREERQQAARVPLAADGPNQQAAAGR